MTADPSGMTYVLDDMMAKEEGRREVEKERLKKESIKAELEAIEKVDLAQMNDIVKLLKKKARRVRSDQNKERVPLSERFEVDASEFLKEEENDEERGHFKNMLDAHLELILDSLADLFDVLDCTDRAFPPELPRELLKLLFSNKELMIMMEALRFPDNLPMKSVLASLAFFQVTAVPVEDRVFLFCEKFPFASVDASDPRLAFINMRMFDESDDERMCQEQSEMDLSCYADLLGVPVDADANTIKKAFRKQSMQCHPDKAESNGLTGSRRPKRSSRLYPRRRQFFSPFVRENE